MTKLIATTRTRVSRIFARFGRKPERRRYPQSRRWYDSNCSSRGL
jgi:hypothetical protein